MPRAKRPSLDRDAPVRSWAAAMAAGDTKTGAATPPSTPASDPAVSTDPIMRGVLSGNRVIEEWIRQAQHAARLMGGNGAPSVAADAGGQVFRAASDAAAAWWAILGMGTPNGAGRPGEPQPQSGPHVEQHAESPTARADMAAPAPAGAVSSRMTVQVSSRRPLSVSLELHTNGASQLRVLDLRPERGRARRIRGVQLATSGADGVRLQIDVPDDQPAGSYHAVIVDASTDRAVGTLTVQIR